MVLLVLESSEDLFSNCYHDYFLLTDCPLKCRKDEYYTLTTLDYECDLVCSMQDEHFIYTNNLFFF